MQNLKFALSDNFSWLTKFLQSKWYRIILLKIFFKLLNNFFTFLIDILRIKTKMNIYRILNKVLILKSLLFIKK